MASRLTGNQFWKLRSDHGREKIFGGDGSLLWEEAGRYWDWCDRHPLERAEPNKYKGDFEVVEVPLGRPYSMDGLTIFLGVSGSYFRTAKGALREKIEEGRATEDERALLEKIDLIETVTRTQQVEGAMVGIFKENLTSRINGLADVVNNNGASTTVLRVSVRDDKTAKDLDKLKESL